MKNRILMLIFGIVSLILVTYVYYILYNKYKIIIPCVFNEITGFYCPGCGITRMIFSVFKLEFYQAFRYNSLVFCLLPFVMFYTFDATIKWITGNKNYLYLKINNKVWILLLIITLAFGIIRNIYLFRFLIPTTI